MTRASAVDLPMHMFRSPFEQAEVTAWQPDAVPNPETEAFLTNLCIDVEHIATRTFYPGQAHQTATRAPLQLFYVLDGHGTYSNSTGTRALKRGTLLVALNVPDLQISASAANEAFDQGHADGIPRVDIPRGGHAPGDGRLTLACIDLSVTSVAELRLFEQLDSALIDHDGGTHMWQTVELLLGEVERQRIGARSIIQSLTKNLVLLAMREHLSKMQLDNPLRLLLSEPRIARAVNAITKNPAQRHTVVTLAQLAAMTPQAFSRRFEAIFAMSPNDFVLHVRLTKAATLLCATDLPVKTIAGKVGFASRSHFSRLFSKFTGCDPTAYRLEQR